MDQEDLWLGRPLSFWLRPRTHKAAVRIQSRWRGGKGRARYEKLYNKVIAAISIQRTIRGAMCRRSDRVVLAHVYLKLPQFWKDIMKSAPPPENARDNIGVNFNNVGLMPGLQQEVDSTSSSSTGVVKPSIDNKRKKKNHRGGVFGTQISELRDSVQNTLGHILKDVAIGGVLAPKLPFIVAQPFDKMPYVSNDEVTRTCHNLTRNSLRKRKCVLNSKL